MVKYVILLHFYVSLFPKQKTHKKKKDKTRLKNEGFVKINICNLY